MNLKKIKQRHWFKFISRDIPLLRLVIIYEALAKEHKKIIGWDYISGLAIGKNGYFDIYRTTEGMAEYYNQFSKIKNKKVFFNKLIELLKNKNKEISAHLKYLSKTKEDKELKYLIGVFKILYTDLKYYWSIQSFPMYIEASFNLTNKDDIKKYHNYLVSIRRLSQSVTVELEDSIDRLLIKIAKVTRINTNLIIFSTPDEILNGKFDIQKLKEKKKLVVVGFEEGTSYVYSGIKALRIDSFFKNILNFKNISKKTEDTKLTGDIAFPGKLKGIVRVIKYRHQLSTFQNGEILVSPMTEAYYLPYLKKSSAIVTDEGGITCHAAIISRELKKPCIVGTKNATEVFKTGDLVEVDAGKGLVTKLK